MSYYLDKLQPDSEYRFMVRVKTKNNTSSESFYQNIYCLSYKENDQTGGTFGEYDNAGCADNKNMPFLVKTFPLKWTSSTSLKIVSMSNVGTSSSKFMRNEDFKDVDLILIK